MCSPLQTVSPPCLLVMEAVLRRELQDVPWVPPSTFLGCGLPFVGSGIQSLPMLSVLLLQERPATERLCWQRAAVFEREYRPCTRLRAVKFLRTHWVDQVRTDGDTKAACVYVYFR